MRVDRIANKLVMRVWWDLMWQMLGLSWLHAILRLRRSTEWSLTSLEGHHVPAAHAPPLHDSTFNTNFSSCQSEHAHTGILLKMRCQPITAIQTWFSLIINPNFAYRRLCGLILMILIHTFFSHTSIMASG